MGFGYLFAGYLFFFNFLPFYHIYTDVFGALVVMLGLSTLKQYAKGFESAFYASFPLALVGLISFVGRLGGLFSLFTFPNELTVVLATATHITKGVFLWFALSGVAQISTQTDIPVLRLKALRNRIFTLAFYVCGVLLETNLFTHVSAFLQYFTLFYMLFGLVYTFLNAKIFFESYIWICLEGDEGMERKESRFGFINKLNAFSDRLDQKTMERKEKERQAKADALKQKQGRKKKKK